jgi:UDP-N-acetylmuramate--alanine ligase
MDDFARAFHQADSVYVLDIYAASEPAMEGVTAEALVQRLHAFGHRGAHYAGAMDRGMEQVIDAARSGDVILTLGAGSVSQAGERILEKLRDSRSESRSQRDQAGKSS